MIGECNHFEVSLEFSEADPLLIKDRATTHFDADIHPADPPFDDRLDGQARAPGLFCPDTTQVDPGGRNNRDDTLRGEFARQNFPGQTLDTGSRDEDCRRPLHRARDPDLHATWSSTVS